MERDEDRMFGSPLNILRGCSLTLLIVIFVALTLFYPLLALILFGVVVLGGIGLGLAYLIGGSLGWWDSI